MKTHFLKGIFALAAVLTATISTAQSRETKVTNSQINWLGKKITGAHNGTIQLQEGTLQWDGDQITGGHFVVDMTTLEVEDLKGSGKEKLEGHLRSDDFFGVESHPTAQLTIKKAVKNQSGYNLHADLTIKGETHPISFDLIVNNNRAQAKLKVDRTKYGIRYGSGSFFDNLGDNTIYDDFELEVTFNF